MGYHLRRWGTTGTTGLYTHTFTEYDVAGVWVNGTQYTLAASLAACGSTSGTKTYFVDVGTSLYIHEHTNGDPNISGTTVKVNSTWGFSRPGAVIPKSDGVTVRPIFYDGRLLNVPSISYKSSPDVLGGGAVVAVGEANLENSDGYFDSRAPKAIWDNQPARLYEGTLGGTIPAGFTLRQSCVTSTPTIDKTTLSIFLQSDTDILKQRVCRNDTLPQDMGCVPVRGQPSPVVFGPFNGIPCWYWSGPTGTGTYYVSNHAIGTVTAVRNGTGGTHPIISTALLSGSPSRIVINDTQFGSFASEPLFIDGTGYADAGGTPTTPGPIIQYLLGSCARVGTSKIDTVAFGTTGIDAERGVSATLSCWFGRGESVQDAIDFVSRSVFTDWAVNRGGTYTAKTRLNTPGSNPLRGNSFQRDVFSWEEGDSLEDFSSLFTNRISNSKILIYNNLLHRNSTAGVTMLRGKELAYQNAAISSNLEFRLRMRGSSGTPSTSGSLAMYVHWNGTGTSGWSAYELIIGTTGTLTLNRVLNGVSSLLGTYVTSGFSATSWHRPALTFSGGTNSITVDFDGTGLVISATDSGTNLIGSGYYGIGISDAATTIAIDRLTWFNNYDEYAYVTEIEHFDNGSSSPWTDASGAFHKGTRLSYDGFIGDKVGHVTKPSGTPGTKARIFRGNISGSAGTDYIFSCVAALRSGSAGTFSLEYVDSGGTSHLSNPYSLGTGTYTRIFHHFRPGSTGAAGTVSIYPNYNATFAGTIWVDNVEMYPVKTIHYWQCSDAEIKSDIKVPLFSQVNIMAYGEGTKNEVPPEPFQSNINENVNYYPSDITKVNSQYLYSGIESLVISGFCWKQKDAIAIANAVQDYYSKPRVSLEMEFLDWQGETINLWDILYFPDGRIPGLPDGYRLFKVVEIEDRHPDDGPPQMWIRCEIPYNPAYDIMDV